jgi:CheY-like chemotaxis protein
VTRRALLAEDDETNQLYAISLLERDGWVVELARTGRDAVALAADRVYDVILMDCQMPELSGYEAVREIRRHEGATRHAPIIALTAHATKSDRERCLAAGMDAYVSKPFDVEALDHALQVARRQEGVAAAGAPVLSLESSASEFVLDPSRLAQLSPDARARVVELFIGSARQRITDLAVAVAAGDAVAAQGIAHSLKGSAATIGATRMSDTCVKIGAALSGGPSDDLGASQSDLATAFALTEAALAA